MAVYDERDRLARDLHDTVIQRFFAAGLALQGIAAATKHAETSDRLNRVISDIDGSIRQLRSSIFGSGLIGGEVGLRARLMSLLDELQIVVGFEVRSSFDGPVDSAISAELSGYLLTSVPCVTNVARHAHATAVVVQLAVVDGQCQLQIIDNGRGMSAERSTEGGRVLVNLRRRAEQLHGRLDIENRPTGGSVLTWRVPLGVTSATHDEARPPNEIEENP